MLERLLDALASLPLVPTYLVLMVLVLGAFVIRVHEGGRHSLARSIRKTGKRWLG